MATILEKYHKAFQEVCDEDPSFVDKFNASNKYEGTDQIKKFMAKHEVFLKTSGFKKANVKMVFKSVMTEIMES